MDRQVDLPQASSWQQLRERISRIGFLPLFQNELRGFSAEELTRDCGWWTGDPDGDPWYWRERLARSGEVAYGKFFHGKAGFVSLDWLPRFVNYRRDGYDFDARWEDGLASVREKKILDCFALQPEWIGMQLKRQAGFGGEGERNFPGVLTQLQMQTYLVIRDFRCKTGRRGQPYGMPVAVYARPEDLWGYDRVTAAYAEDPAASREAIWTQVGRFFPEAEETQLRRLL